MESHSHQGHGEDQRASEQGTPGSGIKGGGKLVCSVRCTGAALLRKAQHWEFWRSVLHNMQIANR